MRMAVMIACGILGTKVVGASPGPRAGTVIVKTIVAALLLASVTMAQADPIDVLLDAGGFVPGPFPNNQYELIHLSGTLSGDEGNLYGIRFDLVNAAPNGWGVSKVDSSAVRALIGNVTTTGPGSVRAVHGHAIGTAGATGPISALNGQVTCPADNAVCRNIEVAATGEGATEGIFFTTSGPGHFSYLLNVTQATVDNGFALLTTGSPAGRLVWTSGGSIDSPSAGVVRIQGVLQSATIAALEARIRALEQQLAGGGGGGGGGGGAGGGDVPPPPPCATDPAPVFRV